MQYLNREANSGTALGQYPITRPSVAEFVCEKRDFISAVAKKMHVEPVRDIGRVPTPFSRVYTFFTDLFPTELGPDAEARPGRSDAMLQARRQFRGIACVMALRETLQLNISIKSFKASNQTRFRRVFDAAYREAPEMHPDSAWDDFRYVVINGPNGAVEPLCGLSPLTLFFPSLAPLSGAKRIFWYDYARSEWFDPTTDWTETVRSNPNQAEDELKILRRSRPHLVNDDRCPVQSRVIKSIRRQIHNWLDEMLSANPQPAWQAFGMDVQRTTKLIAELEEWRRQLAALPMAVTPRTSNKKDSAQRIGLNVQDAGGNWIPVPFLEETVGDVYGGVATELPRMPDGRILLSQSILTDPNRRIVGGIMGRPTLDRCLREIPEMGDHFTITDGSERYFIPERYVVVDKLFLDNIHQIADSKLSANFHALSTSIVEHWLLPFKPAMLHLLSGSELASSNAAARKKQVDIVSEGSGRDRVIRVTVKLCGEVFRHDYPEDNQVTELAVARTPIDLRIWPNFYFLNQPKIPVLPDDRTHYFRVRQQQDWCLKPAVIGQKFDGSLEFYAMDDHPSGRGAVASDRKCKTYVFRNLPDGVGDIRPVGLSFADRGAVFFRLREARHTGALIPWRIGIDFGTSNTCIARILSQQNSADEPVVIRFEVLTDSLHENTVFQEFASDQNGESGSALIDFPYYFRELDDGSALLNPMDFFPSQMVTQIPIPTNDSQFSMHNGLIFPRNLSLDAPVLSDLIKDYPQVAARRELPKGGAGAARVPSAPATLKTNIKWTNRAFRRPFLWHLYKMLTYHAAMHGAVIVEAAFSYPRAFNEDAIDSFAAEVRLIFESAGIKVSNEDMISESEAIQRWKVCNPEGLSQVILDVGGGTTDYLVMHQLAPVFQASHVFAGSFVNEYFAVSSAFRNAFTHAVLAEVPISGEGLKLARMKGIHNQLRELVSAMNDGKTPQDSGAFAQQVFWGLLGLLDDAHYASLMHRLSSGNLGDRSENLTTQRKSITGFFYTIVLLYGGMAYTAGKLLRDSGHLLTNLRIDLVGNGVRFYQMLDHRTAGFGSVLNDLFCDGYGQRVERMELPKLVVAGKAHVAKGLLFKRKMDTSVEAVPGRVGHELAVVYEPAPLSKDKATFEYYLLGKPRSQPIRAEDLFPELREFLMALEHAMPGGKHNGVVKIPFCEENIVTELTAMFPDMRAAVSDAEQFKAAMVRENLLKAEELEKRGGEQSLLMARKHRQAADAVEPRLITQLKVLLRCIRKTFAPAAGTKLFANDETLS